LEGQGAISTASLQTFGDLFAFLAKSSLRLLELGGTKSERIADDQDRTETHRHAGDDWIEQKSERRVMRTGGNGHCERVEHERKNRFRRSANAITLTNV